MPTAGSVTDSLTDGTKDYNVGYWYTFNNEIGESAPSAVKVLEVDTRYTAWNADPADDRKFGRRRLGRATRRDDTDRLSRHGHGPDPQPGKSRHARSVECCA